MTNWNCTRKLRSCTNDLENTNLTSLHQRVQTHYIAGFLLKHLSYLKNNQLLTPAMVKRILSVLLSLTKVFKKSVARK